MTEDEVAKLTTRTVQSLRVFAVEHHHEEWEDGKTAIARERWAIRSDGKILKRLISVTVDGEEPTTFNSGYTIWGHTHNTRAFDLERYLTRIGRTNVQEVSSL